MNKRSMKNKRPAKTAAKTSRKVASHKVTTRAAAAQASVAARRSSRNPLPISAVKVPSAKKIAASETSTVTVAEITALGGSLHTHKFQVGQTVFYTSSPITRPGASGSYKVMRLLPSDGEDYQYRIKNPGEAFERVAKESQLEVEI
jgi:lysozyme family protein